MGSQLTKPEALCRLQNLVRDNKKIQRGIHQITDQGTGMSMSDAIYVEKMTIDLVLQILELDSEMCKVLLGS